MKNAWIILLIVLVAAGAYLLGRRSGESTAPVAAAATDQAPAPLDPGSKPKNDAPPVPVRTFRGPDGRAHIISYDEKNPPDSSDPEQVRQALLSDMKWYPTNIEHNYDFSAEDVKSMAAGQKPIPDYMLPEPGKSIGKP